MAANSSETKLEKFSRYSDLATATAVVAAVGAFGVAVGNPEAGAMNGLIGAAASLANAESERAITDIANGSERLVDRLRARGGHYVAAAAIGSALGGMFNGIEGATWGAAGGTAIAGGLERFVYNRRLRNAEVRYADLNTQLKVSSTPSPDHPLRVA